MNQPLIRYLLLILFALAAPAARGQVARVVIFDENDAVGEGYRDASYGFANGSDALDLIQDTKMPVETDHAYSGATSGRISYRHAGGQWELFIARDRWTPADLSALDSLVLYLNAPQEIAPEDLPRIGLESNNGNVKTPLVELSRYLNGVDGDPATWQRVAIHFSDFEPYGNFTLTEFKTVHFANGTSTQASSHTLWVDAIQAVGAAVSGGELSPPQGLVARAGDRSVVLHWDPSDEQGLAGYNVYRAEPAGVLQLQTVLPLTTNHFVDFDVHNNSTYHYVVRAVDGAGTESDPSEAVTVRPAELDDDAFLDLVQQLAVDYFWYEANPATGLVRDRSRDGSASSIAAVGFGLSALTVGIDHGWISREAGRDRVLTTLETFWNGPQGTASSGTIGYKGFFYHFLKMDTATRSGTSELSTIDTALLLGGIRHVGQYFDGDDPAEVDIRALSDSIYDRVDWQWAQNHPSAITLGWRPESGFIQGDWHGYNEAMIMYVQALGSPTHPVGAPAWSAWTSGYSGRWRTEYGYTFLTFPPLFGHQYSHVWVDFRGRADAYMRAKGIDYFENSRRATLAQQAYAVANPQGHEGYGEDLWGFSASDGPDGYAARGAPPAQNDDGTITPTAPGGSYAFTPGPSLAVLRNMYDTFRTRLWGPYGFRDAFNSGRDWFDTDYLGLDEGPIVLMIENGRTGAIWQKAMADPAIQRGLERAGFLPVDTATEDEAPVADGLTLAPNAPNPFRAQTQLRYTTAVPGRVTITLFDVLGRRVATLVDGVEPAGPHVVSVDGAGLTPGLYLYRVRQGGTVRTGRMVRIR